MVISVPGLDLIKLNDIDVTSYRYDGRIIKPMNQPVKYGYWRFTRRINDAIMIDDSIIGKSFTWQRGFVTATEVYKFRGEVVSWKPMGSFIELTVACKAYVLVRREKDYTYDQNIDPEAGIGSEIMKDLVDIEGLPYTDASIPSTGTSVNLLIKTYPARGARMESLKDLAEGYVRRVYYRDSDDLLYITAEVYEPTTTTLTVGGNVVNRVAWNTTGQDMVNNATLVGGEQLDWNIETFTASAGQTTFETVVIPVDSEVYINGALQARGVDSSDPQDFFVRSDSKQFVFTIAMAGGETVEINYSYNIPAKVSSQDAASIAIYKQRDKTLFSDKVFSSDDGEIKLNGFLEESADPITSAPLRVIGDNTLEIGQLVPCIDTQNNINASYLITGITHYSPYRPDEISVGKKPISTMDIELSILDNLDRLNRKLASNSEVNVQLINNPSDVIIIGYDKLETAPPDVGVLYYDSDETEWDNDDWGDDTEETYTTIYLMPLNQTYYDDFWSTEFKDSVETTATWTTTGTITFTNGQIAQSEYVWKDLSNTLGYATLTADYDGTLTLEISLDGINWETLTNGVEKTFTNQGSYVYWRATSTGVSTLRSIKITARNA